MTAPLTPPDCDVRSLPYMPFEIGRFLDSDLFALSTGDELKAALALWCRSWTQVPAASLPADERLLARMASVSLQEWREIADMATRGWILCDDGRLYHPVVSEKALRGWIERIGMKDRSAKGNSTRHETFKYDPEAFAQRKAEAVSMLARLVPDAASEFGFLLQGGELPPVRKPSGSPRLPGGTPNGSEQNVTKQNGIKGKGTEDSLPVGSAAPIPTDEIASAFSLFNEMASRASLPIARSLSPERRKGLSAILRLHGPAIWSEAMTCIERSPHLTGNNDRGWKADLDFILSPKKFIRIVEGFYGGPSSGGGGNGGRRSYLDAALEMGA